MPMLQDKVAIVTGSASGQGLAEARLFCAEGAAVVLADIDADAGRAAAEEIGENAMFVELDVTEEGQWDALVDETRRRLGGPDVLVNNAGIFKPRPLQGTDSALLDLHYRVNVLGPFLGMKAVHGPMAERGGGAIVNVSSGVALRPAPGRFAYTGSKWMVRGMTKCAALDLAADNIRVNTILPGLIDTPMLDENAPGEVEAITAMIPVGRMGTPEEIAQAALYLVSDGASYVTGAEIAVCGGLVA